MALLTDPEMTGIGCVTSSGPEMGARREADGASRAARSGAASMAACMRCSKDSGSFRGVTRGAGFGRSRSVAPGTRRDSGGTRPSSPMPNPQGARVRG